MRAPSLVLFGRSSSVHCFVEVLSPRRLSHPPVYSAGGCLSLMVMPIE
jgi:hypothetical protein